MLLSGIVRQVRQLIVFMSHAPHFFCYEACYSVFIFMRAVPQFYCCEARSSVYIYIYIYIYIYFMRHALQFDVVRHVTQFIFLLS